MDEKTLIPKDYWKYFKQLPANNVFTNDENDLTCNNRRKKIYYLRPNK